MSYKLLAILTVLFIISGCQAPQNNPNNVVPESVYTGIMGLTMNFMNNLPPTRVYDTGTLDIIAELQNQGTYDLTNGRCVLHLSGYDDSIIRGIINEKVCGPDLLGKTPGFPEGGYDTAEFSTSLIQLPQGIDVFPQTFTLSACYEYETLANPIVCIDPQQYKIRPISQACIVQNVPVSGGQGAPVSVSQVQVQMIGDAKASFTILVQNSGQGTVLAPGIPLSGNSIGSCPFRLNVEDYNVVNYEVSMSDGYLIKCSPDKLRLVNGQGKIFCTFNTPGDSARTTPLRIKLSYDYLQSITKTVQIVKTPG